MLCRSPGASRRASPSVMLSSKPRWRVVPRRITSSLEPASITSGMLRASIVVASGLSVAFANSIASLNVVPSCKIQKGTMLKQLLLPVFKFTNRTSLSVFLRFYSLRCLSKMMVSSRKKMRKCRCRSRTLANWSRYFVGAMVSYVWQILRKFCRCCQAVQGLISD